MNLIIFASPLHDATSVMSCRQDLFEKLRDRDYRKEYGLPEEGELNIIDSSSCENLPTEDAVCFIGTGGTEELFADRLGQLPKEIILLSDGYHNSLAASFEIASFLDRKGIGVRMVNIPAPPDGSDTEALPEESESKNRFGNIYTSGVREYLANSTVGLIGGASSWLIASDVDLKYIQSEFGTRFVDIDIAELADEYMKLSGGATEDGQGETGRLEAAGNMEKALRTIVGRYGLNALTIKCFDLLGSCRTTACLALARLNDEGIICGCEGDIPSLWTMMTVYAHSGKAPFMANPSSSDRSRLRVDFAHCTVPTSMTTTFSLPTHFESGIGVGVAGVLPTGRYSIVKIGGRRLDRIFWASGTITANTNVAARCRTQVAFRFDNEADFDRFFANRLGNHIILTDEI